MKEEAGYVKILFTWIAYCYVSTNLVFGQSIQTTSFSPDSGTCFSESAHNTLRNEVRRELIKSYCPSLYSKMTNPNRPILMTEIFGKCTGNIWNDIVSFCNLDIIGIHAMQIYHDDFHVISIQVSYRLANELVYEAPKRGGSSGTYSLVELAEDERVTQVQIGTNGSVVNYLTITSQNSTGRDRTQGPYGATTWQTPSIVSGYILGFSGCSTSSVYGLGVLYLPPLIRVNETYGGTCMDDIIFDDKVDKIIPPVVGVRIINLYHIHLVHALQITYTLLDGSTYEGIFVGNNSIPTVRNITIRLSNNDVIYQVNATADSRFVHFLAGLTFFTSLKETSMIYGPYGDGDEIPVPIPGIVLGFHGYFGFNHDLRINNICRIGVYRVANFNSTNYFG